MSNYSNYGRQGNRRTDGRPQNVGVDDQGNRVVGLTSAQRSGLRNSSRLVVPGVLDKPAGPAPAPKPAAQGLIGESRAERVAQAKADGTFAATRRKYNQENPQQRMNKKGDILPRNPAAPETMPGGATTAPPMTREQRVAEAKANGTFEQTRNKFNAQSKHQWMDDQGMTRVGPKITADGKGGKTLEGKYGTGSVSFGPAGTKVAGEPVKINGLQPDPGKLPDTLVAKPADALKLETPQITTPIAAANVRPTALPAGIGTALASQGTGTIQQSPGMGMMGPSKFNDTRSHLAGTNAETTQMDEARKKARTA